MNPCMEEGCYYKLDNMILNSFQHLRKIFKDRWKSVTGEEWVDDPEHLRRLLDDLGQTANKTGLHFQKSALEGKSVVDWDMPVLTLVLQNFPSGSLQEEQKVTAVQQLKNLRDVLAYHHGTSKKIPESEFQANVNIFRSSLRSLGVTEPEVTKLIENSGSSSSTDALKLAKALYTKADDLFHKGHFEKALEYYSKAIKTPNLLLADRSIAYQKRAEYYIGMASATKDIYATQDMYSGHAKDDIDKALELDDSTWTVHYIAAQCHMFKDIFDKSQAILYYERALAICPLHERDRVKTYLDMARTTDGMLKVCLKDPSIEKTKKVFNFKDEDAMRWEGRAQKLTWGMMVAIHEKAKEGSDVALGILQTFNYSMDLEDLLKLEVEYSEKQKMEILDLAYNVALRDYHLVTMPDKLKVKMRRILSDLFQDGRRGMGEIDMKVRYCLVIFNTPESASGSGQYPVGMEIELLKEGIRRYPGSVHYYVMLVIHLNIKEKLQKANFYVEQGLQRFPGNVDLLFCRAGLLRNLLKLQETNEAFKEFLKVAATDDKRAPQAYYEISCVYMSLRKLDQANIHFLLGQEAEKDQLPCYMPYEDSVAKRLASTLLGQVGLSDSPSGNSSNKKSTKSSPETSPSPGKSKSQPAPKSVLERKKYLNSTTRKEIVLEQREHLNKTDFQLNGILFSFPTAVTPKFKQIAPKDKSHLKPITLSQMDRSQDRIFENRILDLTIIDDPNPNYASITVIAEDQNRDVIRVYVYNVDRSKETMDHYRAGCRFAIMNPYIMIGAICGTSGTRVDDPKCIVFKGKVENMCRFCGEEGASSKCSRCKRPYCSKECQTLDWKMFHHKLICPIKY